MAQVVMRCEVGLDENGRVYLAFRDPSHGFTVTLTTRTARAFWSALGATLRHDAHVTEAYELQLRAVFPAGEPFWWKGKE